MSKTKTKQLFARFAAIYSGRWVAAYPSEAAMDLAIAEWSKYIERMSDEQLCDGIEWATTCCAWPPSIAEFLHAGLGIDELEIRDKAIYLSGRAGMPCGTYRELDAAAKIGRTRAIQSLVEDRLRPAIEQERRPALGHDRASSEVNTRERRPRRLGLVKR